MVKYALALVVASLAALDGVIVFAQQPQCLHGPSEVPEQMARRRAALSHTRQINTAEAAARARTHSYTGLDALAIPAAPNGFDVQLSTDGTTYTFSVKDATDACRFAFFSDQDGIIFTATPIQ